MMNVVPKIDPRDKIPLPPTCIRYHFNRRNVWAMCSVNGADYVTAGYTFFSHARKAALVDGTLFRVEKWIPVSKLA